VKKFGVKIWCHEIKGVTQKKEKNKETNKNLKWKSLMSWKKKSKLRKNNKDINKIMAKKNYLKKIDKDIFKHINIRAEKDL